MVRRILPLLAAVALLVASSTPLLAKGASGPEKKFAGKVMMSDKRFPTSAKSPSAYVAAIKKQSKVRFQEDKDKKAWKIYFAAFMKKAPSDIEVTIKILDASTRPATVVASFNQFMDTRGQRALISNFTLERETVGVNRNLVAQVESGGVVLATGKFTILGEAERYTGKVDFSDDDTK